MLQKSRFSKRPEAPDGRTLDLDQARVSSMADEGGAAGATMDAQEQCAPCADELTAGERWRSWLTIGLVAGCAMLAGALFASSRPSLFRRGRSRWLLG
jgi:hypothetical protein